MSEDIAVGSQDLHSTMLVSVAGETKTSKEIKEALEGGDLAARAAALEEMIRLHLNGESQNHMIMTVIKYVTPLDDHLIKKLVLYFWEVIDKTDADGKLLGVIILICSFLRNDLQHPNEYVRGLTLRFLCKLKEKDIIEQLITPVVQNLSDKVAYVRRNAVLAVHAIYSRFPDLLPEAPEMVDALIRKETDASARRGAFDVLASFAPERASLYLADLRESGDLSAAGSAFLMSVVNFCHAMIQANPYDKAKYVPVLFAVLQSRSPAVRYQCARTLLALTSSPTALREATLTYVDLLKTQTDNTVRLIVLDQLSRMRGRYLDVLQNSLADILSGLPGSPVPIRQRIVSLAVDVVTGANMDTFLHAMRKELAAATSDSDMGAPAAAAYRGFVVRAISSALARHPQHAGVIVPVLLDYLADDAGSGSQIVLLLKEVLARQPGMRASLLGSLLEMLPLLTSSAVLRAVMWILAAHSQGAAEVRRALDALSAAMQPLPLAPPAAPSPSAAAAASAAAAVPQVITTVREDGTYATTYTTAPAVSLQEEAAETSGLRGLICRGDFFLAAALGSTLAKLTAQLFAAPAGDVDEAARNAAQSEAVALVRAVLAYGETSAAPLDEDSEEHLRLALALLANPAAPLLASARAASRRAFEVVGARLAAAAAAAGGSGAEGGSGAGGAAGRQAAALTAVDAPLTFTQLGGGGGAAGEAALAANEEEEPAAAARAESAMEQFVARLEGTVALSGFSDPIYCEASVEVRDFEVVLHWALTNCTSQPLTNVTIELASLGGMKLCERPQAHALRPFETIAVKTALKVGATEAGVIFGNVLYDAPRAEACCVILNDIHVDIVNYIKPARCDPAFFRDRWRVIGWENKVQVATAHTSLRAYARALAHGLNMSLVEPLPDDAAEDEDEAIAAELGPAATATTTGEGEGDGEEEEEEEDHVTYLSSNLFAKTIFGEEAFANIAIEKSSRTGAITGMVRVRSKTPTLVYGIGEKIQMIQSGKTGTTTAAVAA